MRPLVAAILVATLYVLHQDFWFWRTARPLVFGVLPIGLLYHVAYTLATAALMWLLVGRLWPAHLESTQTSTPELEPGPAATPELELSPATRPTSKA